MQRDHPVELAVPRDHELEAHAEAVQQRVAGAHPPQAADRHPEAAQFVVVLDRLGRDVVREPLGLLVRVGVTTDVDQQRRVVDDRALVLVEPHPLGEPQRDQALPQHVLHRLAEAEVDAERQRGNELGQAGVGAVGLDGHRPTLPATRGQARAQSPGTANGDPATAAARPPTRRASAPPTSQRLELIWRVRHPAR